MYLYLCSLGKSQEMKVGAYTKKRKATEAASYRHQWDGIEAQHLVPAFFSHIAVFLHRGQARITCKTLEPLKKEKSRLVFQTFHKNGSWKHRSMEKFWPNVCVQYCGSTFCYCRKMKQYYVWKKRTRRRGNLVGLKGGAATCFQKSPCQEVILLHPVFYADLQKLDLFFSTFLVCQGSMPLYLLCKLINGVSLAQV